MVWENCIRIVWRHEQFASGFYEDLSNFHQDFMKVWAISIRISRRSEQFPAGLHAGLENALRFYDGLKSASGLYEGPKICVRISWRSEQFASGFYEGLNSFHQDFMKVRAISIRISWRPRTCIMILWWSEKMHQDCTKVWKKVNAWRPAVDAGSCILSPTHKFQNKSFPYPKKRALYLTLPVPPRAQRWMRPPYDGSILHITPANT